MSRRLILIFFITLLLRVISLSSFPAGFTPDEASFGYDAYSLMTTGRDQWGRVFPLVLESFGDFKPPLYAYLTVPSVWLFGLTKTAVRFPNALLGSLAVISTYFLAKELGEKLKWSRERKEHLALLASLLLAVSPWHVMLSRGAFEANLTTFFMTSGVYLFLRGLIKPKLYLLSAIFFGLNMFTYHAARVVTPIIFALLIVTFWNQWKNLSKKYIGVGIFVFSILLTVYTFSLGAGARAKDISIFGGSAQEAATARLDAINSGTPFIISKALHNKYVVTFNRFVKNYSQYFSYRFLYDDGPAEGTYGMIPGRGVSYLFELPFLVGFIYLFLKSKSKKILLLIIIWLVIAPAPAAMAAGRGYAANRAAIMLPALQILYAFGALGLWSFLSKRLSDKFRILVIILYTLIAFTGVAGFLFDYFVLSPQKNGKSMLSGNLEAATLIVSKDDTQKILVSKGLSEPQIYIAFAKKWDPVSFQKYSDTWQYEEYAVTWVDQIPEYQLGNYTFATVKEETMNEYDFVIARPSEFPVTVVPIEIIKYPDGEAAIYIVAPTNDTFAYEN